MISLLYKNYQMILILAHLQSLQVPIIKYELRNITEYFIVMYVMFTIGRL